jgi:hypothetical protein
MSESGSANPTTDQDLLAELADDVARRCRRGERPSLEEYIQKYPSLADQIRDMFPAILAMEQSRPRLTPDAALATERVGTVIGRYKLLEPIGEGGYGTVFHGRADGAGSSQGSAEGR